MASSCKEVSLKAHIATHFLRFLRENTNAKEGLPSGGFLPTEG